MLPQEDDNFQYLDPAHIEDLRKSGLSDETIREAGIRTVPLKELPFTPPGAVSAYEIPFSDGFSRYRVFFKDGLPAHKKPSKYLQAAGSGNRLYFTKLAEQVLDDVSQDLYITEGEKKALKVSQENMPCIAVTGLWNWSEGKKKLLPDFDRIKLKGRTAYLVPDNDFLSDAHGYPTNLKQAVIELGKKLIDKGADVKVIELPPGPKKIGVDDYLAEGNSFLFCKIIDLGLEKYKKKSKPYFLSIAELFDLEDLSFEWIVEGLIPAANLIMVAAEPGSYKTWLALEMARCVSQGTPFLGRNVKQSQVVYVDLENPANVGIPRMKKLGFSRENINFKFWPYWASLIGKKEPPKFPADLERLGPAAEYLDIVAEERPLIIFDTLIRFCPSGTDENRASEMAIVTDFLRALTRQGSSVVFLHHSGKGEGGAKDYRGSSEIAGGVDVAYRLRVKKKSYGDIQTVHLETIKSRQVEQSLVFKVRNDNEMVTIFEGIDEEFTKVQKIIKELEQDNSREPKQREIIKLAKEKLDIGKDKVLDVLKKGEGKFWNKTSGPKNTMLYSSMGDEK